MSSEGTYENILLGPVNSPNDLHSPNDSGPVVISSNSGQNQANNNNNDDDMVRVKWYQKLMRKTYSIFKSNADEPERGDIEQQLEQHPGVIEQQMEPHPGVIKGLYDYAKSKIERLKDIEFKQSVAEKYTNFKQHVKDGYGKMKDILINLSDEITIFTIVHVITLIICYLVPFFVTSKRYKATLIIHGGLTAFGCIASSLAHIEFKEIYYGFAIYLYSAITTNSNRLRDSEAIAKSSKISTNGTRNDLGTTAIDNSTSKLVHHHDIKSYINNGGEKTNHWYIIGTILAIIIIIVIILRFIRRLSRNMRRVIAEFILRGQVAGNN